jgi:DNA uptake protein ComE-like DNA-binding protein
LGTLSVIINFNITQKKPVENIYLKIFHVLYTEKPANAAGVIRAYKKVFPDESEQIDTVVRQTLLGQILPTAPEIWLANRNFQTGSSLFDQFRSLPRSHTFDLNAATLLDLLAVPGMTRSAADLILKNAPYAGVGDLKRVPGITQALLSGFEEMSAEMRRLEAGEQEDEAGLSLGIILRSYAWRAVAMLVLASVGAAFLYRRARRCGALRATINGTGASLLVLALAWITTDTAAIIAFAAPLLVFGIPAVLWQVIRRRGLAPTARTFAAWTLAAVPAVVMAYPWL